MAILERRVQALEKGKRDAYTEYEKKHEAIEIRLGGFPAKKHYGVISGSHSGNTVVWEREWESFTAMEAAYLRAIADPKPEVEGVISPIVSEWIEYYWSMD